MFSIGSYAQDAIARQAPSDKRMKDIRNVKLYNKIETIDLDNPASDIYTDWTEDFRRCSGSVPSNYQIDLRGFCMPTTSRKVTSNYGRRWRKQHEGIDVKVYTGDTIRAAFDGKVRICKYNRGGYGYYIVIRHPNGLETLYGHLSKQIVKKDQIVRAGEPIGLGGNTGKSSGSHLHFETLQETTMLFATEKSSKSKNLLLPHVQQTTSRLRTNKSTIHPLQQHLTRFRQRQHLQNQIVRSNQSLHPKRRKRVSHIL